MTNDNLRQEAKRLYLDEHLTPAQIAERLGIQAGTVRKWKQRDKWDAVTETVTHDKRDETPPKPNTAAVEIPLTDAQELFCQLYVKQFNATMAYMKSHPESSYQAAITSGSRLLTNAKIRDRVNQLKEIKLQSILVGTEDLVEKHMRIAFADITNYITWGFDGADNQMAATPSEMVDGDLVKSVSKTDKGFKIELHDPHKSLDWLANYFLANPLDRHEIDFDNRRLILEENKLAIEKAATSSNGTLIIPDAIWRSLMNDAYAAHLAATQPRQIFFGGSSSGKSFAILGQRAVRDIMTGKRNYLICRKVAGTIRRSAFNEIWKCITRMDLEGEFERNKSEMIVTHKPTRCQILFSGLDDVEKVKSITPEKGVITDIIVEEATETDYDDYKQLDKRLRGDTGDNTVKRITLLFNPILQDHWIYTEFFAGKWDDSKDYYCDDDLLILRTTYKDNRWLTPDDIRKLENETDKYYYDVYTLGKWGVLGNLIYTNWEIKDLSDLYKATHHFHNGQDFGFFPDPAAFVRTGYNRAKKEIYIFLEEGGTDMTNDMLAEVLKPIIRKEVLTCDSAEPKSIQELNNFGINAVPAVKGPDSLEFGIKWMQRQKIFIDPRCVNTILEFKKYKYQEDRNGRVLPKPVDRDNHYLDSLRYALESVMLETKVV